MWTTALKILLIASSLVACTQRPLSPPGAHDAADAAPKITLKVGASAVPHTPILQHAVEVLARQNIALKIITFNDYVQPNLRLSEGDLDANYYQTQPYLDFFNAQHHLDLVSLGRVHIEPFGLYSRKHKRLADLPEGAWVAIPNEISNGHRALALLAQAGVITLDAAPGLGAGVKHITDNPKHLRFKEVEAAMMPRIVGEVDVAGINTNFALSAGLSPAKDSLALETADSPYANILVSRAKDADNKALHALLVALHGSEVVAFMRQQYKGSVITAP